MGFLLLGFMNMFSEYAFIRTAEYLAFAFFFSCKGLGTSKWQCLKYGKVVHFTNLIFGKLVPKIWVKMRWAQSDCRIFKSTVSPEQKDRKGWFSVCLYRFTELSIKNWLKNIGMGMVKNGCGHPGLRTLKLAVSQEEISGINWFLCWYKLF